MKPRRGWLALVLSLLCSACQPAPDGEVAKPEAGVGDGLLRVGSIVILPSDLDYHLKEKHGGRDDEATRKQALEELANRARFAQAAIDAGLDRDPVVRAENARVLASRLRETELFPKLTRAAEPVPEARLRELYAAQRERFRSGEKRRVAVLWLNPGKDPEREKAYQEKLGSARDWFLQNREVVGDPGQGFAVLAVDHSEHAASRFRGGMLGWFEADGGATDWGRAVVEIVYSMGEVGDVSPVITTPEGVFLVRFAGVEAGMERPFESVRSVLEGEEQRRQKQEIEESFEQEIEGRYR